MKHSENIGVKKYFDGRARRIAMVTKITMQLGSLKLRLIPPMLPRRNRKRALPVLA